MTADPPAGPGSSTTLFIVEDHPVVREGIGMLVEAAGGVRVVGAAQSASGALRELGQLAPEVVLLDLDLGDEDGLEWLPRILATAPGARVLILTALRDESRQEAALHAGARGFVHKDAPADVLVRAIRAVAAGELWFDPAVLRAQPPEPAAPPGPPGRASLTTRENEVVALVVEGLRNEEIARRLGINEKTVRNHLTAVFAKMGVSGRLELVVLAYRQGMARPRK
ncbi:MAG TPA: response regulator transcription factor [Anaeromyxobacter sp.]